MKATLVIMAGSRYGGEKQTDGIGPHGEAIMEYSVYDAVRAGFHKIVFIIKPGMEPTIRALCGDRIETMHTPQGEPVEVKPLHDFSDQYHAAIDAYLAEEGTTAFIYRNNLSAVPMGHGPRGPVRPGCGAGALCYYQRRRLLRRLGL